MNEMISIIIAEDKPLFRKTIIRELSRSNILTIGEATNGEELLQLLTDAKTDVILLDLEMPVMDGSKAFNIAIKSFPGIKVIILSMHFEEELVENYLLRGAKGYIPKDAVSWNIELLVEAIARVKKGETYVYKHPFERKIAFTSRQKEILPLIFEGKTNEEIAEEMSITKRGVEKHKQKIYEKSGVERTIDFYKFAFTRGLQFLSRIIPHDSEV